MDYAKPITVYASDPEPAEWFIHPFKLTAAVRFLQGWLPDDLKGEILDVGEPNMLTKRLVKYRPKLKIINTEGNLNWGTWRPERQFDTVLCVDVIEHLMNPAAFLRELHRRMKPGGRLYLTTPKRSLSILHLPSHFFEAKRSDLLSLFEEAGGFDVIRIFESKYLYPWQSLLGGIIRPWLRFLFATSLCIEAIKT